MVIPLFFYAEHLVDPRFGTFVRTMVRSQVVPADALTLFESGVARVTRWTNSWVPDVVCLTLFRFLMLRWLLRLVVWAFFLWRVSRLNLRLVPTHPDGVAGLGYLEVVTSHFAPLVCALSILQSASLIEELSAGASTFESIMPSIALVLVVDAVLFVLPLFIFFARLWDCQVKGLSDYMEFGSAYVDDFDTKWIAPAAPHGEALLGTADLQSLADLNNSLSVVRNLRLVPGSVRLVMGLGIAALWPMLPLLLFKYPLSELAAKFVERLTGL